MLADERDRLHALPEQPVTVAFGQTRRVGWDSTISVDGVRYSVPHQLVDERVWARWAGDELVVTVVDADGPREIARHPARAAGPPADPRRALPTRSPGRTAVPGDRGPRRPATRPRQAFLAIGDGARPG